ncbi:MAG: hypothetical protein ABIQ60_00145 [Burkholderiaceae bacterium]
MNQAIGQRALAMIDVSNDREVSDVIHAWCNVFCARIAMAGPCVESRHRDAMQRPEENAPKAKKRRVESMTRLPTKRLATACWEFIVVKTDGLQTALWLDFSSLQHANRKSYEQVINKQLCMSWG